MYVLVRENENCDYTGVVAVSDNRDQLITQAKNILEKEYSCCFQNKCVIHEDASGQTMYIKNVDGGRNYLFKACTILEVPVV